VILIHRLMKNGITAATGIRAYAALTEQAANAIRLPEFFEQARNHIENSDDFGAVTLRVLDMQPVWQRRKTERNAAVAEADRAFEDVSADLPVPPDRAWHFLTDPDHRGGWVTDVVKTTQTGKGHGRTQVGSIDHCAHGDGSTLIFSIVEWRPPERVTYHLGFPLGAYCPYTIFIAPTPTGCRVTVRTGMPIGPDMVRQAIVRMMARRMAPKLRQNWIAWFVRLAELAKQDARVRNEAPSSIPVEDVLKVMVDSRLTAG
jgi:uncharacterized protein YndB with AHSA1/START domain